MKNYLRPVFCAVLALTAHPVFSEESLSQKDAEMYASSVFHSDISAGRLTRQQAGTFFKCGNDRYAKQFSANPQMAITLGDAVVALNEATRKLSDAEKEKYGRAYKQAAKLQKEAEDGCRKELGIDPSVTRLFSGLGFK